MLNDSEKAWVKTEIDSEAKKGEENAIVIFNK